jgi:hypothetical protein
MKIDKLDLFWINFKTFLTRPITFLICAPILMALIGLFFFRFQPTDPDLWWHLQVGKDIFKHGLQFIIQSGDLYSYTRGGYQWVDHEWLYNCGVFLLYAFGLRDFYWLSIAFGLITFFSFYYILANSINQRRLDEGQIALWLSLLITLLAALPYIGIRAQTISNLGLSLLLGAFVFKWNWEKDKFVWLKLPLLFLLWANLHGSVIIGLFILFIDFINSLIKKRIPDKSIKYKFALLILCTCLTLVNPYGVRVYEEALRVFIDQDSHFWIDEWRALNFNKENTYLLILYLISFIALLLNQINISSNKINNHLNKSNRKDISFKSLNVVLSLIFLIMAIKSVRHIPLFLIVNGPIYCTLWEAFFKKLRYKLSSLAFKFLLTFLIFIYGISFSFMASQASGWVAGNKANSEKTLQHYPQKAIDFILSKAELRNKNIFATEYTWGNFIPWYSGSKYSESKYSAQKYSNTNHTDNKYADKKIKKEKIKKEKIKVFIDGRMPSWGIRLPWEKQIASESVNDINFCKLNSEKESSEQKHFLNVRTINTKQINNFPQQTILHEYKQILFTESGYEKLIDKYKIELILAKKSNFKNQHSEDFKKNWKKIHEDDLSVLFKKLEE